VEGCLIFGKQRAQRALTNISITYLFSIYLMISSIYHEVNGKNGQMPTQFRGEKMKKIEMLAKVSISLFKMP
jgi:hypothetical protein